MAVISYNKFLIMFSILLVKMSYPPNYGGGNTIGFEGVANNTGFPQNGPGYPSAAPSYGPGYLAGPSYPPAGSAPYPPVSCQL